MGVIFGGYPALRGLNWGLPHPQYFFYQQLFNTTIQSQKKIITIFIRELLGCLTVLLKYMLSSLKVILMFDFVITLSLIGGSGGLFDSYLVFKAKRTKNYLI